MSALASSTRRRVTFDDCYRPAPPEAVQYTPSAIPQGDGGIGLDLLPPQNARHEPFQLGSNRLTIERLSTNGYRPPLTRQYVDDPTTDPTNFWWQAISSHPAQQYGRAKLEEAIRQGEQMRPEFIESREPWQRAASLTRLRPPAKFSGLLTERSRRNELGDDTIYALQPDRSLELPDCSGVPANLASLWKSVTRQPHERPKKVFEKRLIERYPEVYGENGATSPIINPTCPPPPLTTSYKPFPYHSVLHDPSIRPWTSRV